MRFSTISYDCIPISVQDVARTRCIVSVCVVVIFGRRLECRGGSGDSGHSTNATRRRFSEVLEAAAPPPSTPPPLWGEEHAELTPQFRTALRGAARRSRERRAVDKGTRVATAHCALGAPHAQCGGLLVAAAAACGAEQPAVASVVLLRYFSGPSEGNGRGEGGSNGEEPGGNGVESDDEGEEQCRYRNHACREEV